jgi:DNA-binding NarL/FixJ family response regulator
MTGSRPPRIVLADRHVPTLAGLRTLLEAAGFEVCAEVETAEGAVAAASAERPDLCLLEAELPGGIDAVATIASAAPTAAVVMLAATRDEQLLLDALRAGAAGYLLKEANPERLPYTLRAVLAGEGALPRALTQPVIEELRESSRRRRLPPAFGKRGVRLSARELDVLEALYAGLTTKQVAARLSIADVTVRRHVSAAVAKLGLADRAALLQWLRDAAANRPPPGPENADISPHRSGG